MNDAAIITFNCIGLKNRVQAFAANLNFSVTCTQDNELLRHSQGFALQDYSAYVAALRAYGYQTGKAALAPAGQMLYSAYAGITDALKFSQ